MKTDEASPVRNSKSAKGENKWVREHIMQLCAPAGSSFPERPPDKVRGAEDQPFSLPPRQGDLPNPGSKMLQFQKALPIFQGKLQAAPQHRVGPAGSWGHVMDLGWKGNEFPFPTAPVPARWCLQMS